jgi:hypothetical protein
MQLVEKRKFYWVEAMKSYRLIVYRVLITKKEPSIELEEYPVEKGDGLLLYSACPAVVHLS